MSSQEPCPEWLGLIFCEHSREVVLLPALSQPSDVTYPKSYYGLETHAAGELLIKGFCKADLK